MRRLDEHFDRVIRQTILDRAEEELVRGRSFEEVEALIMEASAEIPRVLLDRAPAIAAGVRRDARPWLREHRALRHSYRKEIEKHWRRAFDLYEVLLRMCVDAGSDFAAARMAESDPKEPVIGPVITRIQARACRISEEVLDLMRAGFAEGALARWRALHELSVVSSFIAKYGDAAGRGYLDHRSIDRFRAMQEYRRCQPRLEGYEPLTADEIAIATDDFNAVIEIHGKGFEKPYGWALPFLKDSDPARGHSGLRALEADVDLDHFRAHYQHASQPVHSTAVASMASPDLMPDIDDGSLIGPSPWGLADPGHGALISLTLISTTLATLVPTLGSVVNAKAMLMLCDQAGEEFLGAHHRLEAGGSAGFGLGWERGVIAMVRRIGRYALARLPLGKKPI